MWRFYFSIGLCSFFISCHRDAPTGPCEEVNCNDQGYCLHGNCVCDEGFSGDLCEVPIAPEDIYIDQIIVRNYPIYLNGNGWDSLLSGPYFLPDLQVQLKFPWGDIYNSWCYPNASGDPLIWTIETFPYLDNHIHYGDTLELTLLELDGVDSLEVVAPPEVLADFQIVSSEFILADSTNWWPTQTNYGSDSSSTQVVIYWHYEWE